MPLPREKVRQPGADHRIHRAKYRDSIFLALLLSLVATGACEGQGEHKNVCPIDAQPPEWSMQRDPQTCEYFHWSYTERQTHSWAAPCEQK
jgi:hypothetical protein